MTETSLEDALRQTLDDGRLSRGERSALGALFADLEPDRVQLVRDRVFSIARAELDRRPAPLVLDWCEAVLHLLAARATERLRGERDVRQEAWFSPDDACARRIVEAIDTAARSIDVCVFTLTDDRIAAALCAAHRRRLAVRVITDDEKSGDLGSDVHTIAREGVAVRTDRAASHMHHKFAVFDERLVLTGSYNWTRSADRDNHENFVVSDDPVLVGRFRAQFDRLWHAFAP